MMSKDDIRWLWLCPIAISLSAIVAGTTVSCIAARDNLSPPIASPTSEVTTSVDSGRDSTVSTSTDVGGGGDSISLWLAIVALAASSLAYPVGRALRLASKKRTQR